ncbi:MAG: SDR family NAD(P)-dependent oxidoreductase [Opitutaceae bacterium]|nr:SDR family NAD(P)-dependent oxidoreductase [Opitutaceae bacterium]
MSAARVSDLYRTALVTGASAGLGRAFAEMLLAEGVGVWGTARDIARLAPLAAGRTPAAFTPVALDLADGRAAAADFARAAEGAGGAFDLVVQNAGYGVFGEFSGTDFSVWQAQLDAMLLTTARLSHAAFSAMRARRHGCLVHVTSLATEFPLPFMSGYNIAKAGLSALSESLIFETRGTAVTVIDFRPGDYRTAFNQSMQPATAAAPVSAPAAVTPEGLAKGPTADPRLARARQILTTNLQSAPPPVRAAGDLRRALLRQRRGVVHSGSFFQARLAPLLGRLTPAALVRSAAARYFGLT